MAAWEEDASRDAPSGARAALLHGLYVTPHWQRRGLGTSVLELASHRMIARGFGGIIVRVWREAVAFFRSRGFSPLASFNTAGLYPQRMWKAL